MNKPALISEKIHETLDQPILVIDKKGVIGTELIRQLKNEGLVIYVSEKTPDIEEINSNNIIHIPFQKKIPTIPENNYSYIFVVDDNDVLREATSSILKKAEGDHSTLIFISSLLNYDEKLITEIKNYNRLTKVIIYGDLFSNVLIESRSSTVNKLIYEAKTYGKIEIEGDGTRTLYPIFINDLIRGILESVFGSHREEKIFYLYHQHGITHLSFAHMLQKKYPWIKTDFIKEKNKNCIIHPSWEGNYSIAKNFDLEKNINEISFEENQILSERKKIKIDKKKTEKRGKKFPILTLVFFLVLFILLPLVSTLSLSFLGVNLLKSAKENFVKGDIEKALKQAEISKKTFSYASSSLKPLEYELAFIKQKERVEFLGKDIETGKNISSAAISFFKASKIFLDVLNGKAKNPKDEFINGTNLIKDAITILQKEKNKNNLIEEFDKTIEESLNFASLTIDMWPTLMGFDDKKTYLVLLQNNMELRPGGGFIGSYATLTLDEGRVTNFQINDVYNADGQLKAHIEPQYAIRRYLKEKHLYLRDSNFDLDFRNVASVSALLFNLETGEKVNGVIGVDLSFVKNLLNTIGEVEVIDYNEKVNSENLFYVTESHVEKGFFPGSTQKKDFLGSLYNSILSKFTQEKEISYFKLLSGIVKSVEEKHLLFAFSNPSIQNLFTVNGWSSSLWDERKDAPQVINDFIGINESNFGANKVNYFISRSVSQRVEITNEGKIIEEITLSYKNTSDGKWPGGDYKNYLRVILPYKAEIESITINDEKQKIIDAITDPSMYEKTDFKEPVGLEVEKTTEQEKDVFGFLITVPKGELLKVSIKYSLIKEIDVKKSSFTYDLRLIKQSGIDSFPYDLLVKYPKDYQVLKESKGMVSTNSQSLYETSITKDEDVSISFRKK